MLDTALLVNRFLLKYCRTLMADLPDERLTEQPAGGINHPAWILGHLALSARGVGKSLDLETPPLPAGWDTLFGQGSKLTTNRAEYPSKDELLTTLEATFATARSQVAAAPAERFARPSIHPRTKNDLPTVKDVVAFLLTGHLGVHVGQLSTWRRLIGLPPLF